MTTKVNKSPDNISFNLFKVADPVEGSDIRAIADGLSFLEGYSMVNVAAVNNPLLYSAAVVDSGSLFIPYWKSVGAKVVAIEMEPPVNVGTTNDAPKTAYMDVTLPTGATWIGVSQFDSSVSSSLREYRYVNTGSVARPSFRALVDVTNVSSASITTFTCAFTELTNSLSASRGHGFNSITISELPRAYVFTSSTDVGLEASWTSGQQRGQIVDGTTTTGYGFKRLVFELDRARYQVRSQQNLCILDGAENYAWYRAYNAATGSLTYGVNTWNVDNTDRYFFFRAKNLYGTGDTTAPYTVRVTYRTFDGTGTHKLVFRYRAYGSGGAFSYQEIDCTPSTTITSVDATINFPTTGTNQECEWFLEGNVTSDPADILYIYGVFIAESFT